MFAADVLCGRGVRLRSTRSALIPVGHVGIDGGTLGSIVVADASARFGDGEVFVPPTAVNENDSREL